MVLGAIAISPTSEPPDGMATLTPEEDSEIIEYERIVQFSNSVLAGTHPRVKIPAHLEKPKNLQESSSKNNTSSVINLKVSAQLSETSPVTSHDETRTINKSSNSQPNLGSNLKVSNKSEINPILLEKSEDLIKAEIQLQRQRLERALREQVEHQRIVTKALQQTSESLPNFDISEVISKAFAIVPPCTSVGNGPTAAIARSTDSNSFDDNTFYSSQNDTSDSSNSIQDQKAINDKPYDTGILHERNYDLVLQGNDKDLTSSNFSFGQTNNYNNNNNMSQNYEANLHLFNVPRAKESLPEKDSSRASRQEIDEERSKTTQEITTNVDYSPKKNTHFKKLDSFVSPLRPPKRILKQGHSSEPVPTPSRNYNLSPVAPQPERVLPLATASNPLILCDITDDGKPAQVAALRNRRCVSSTDSSPKGRVNEKRKEKKKKRKNKDSSMPDSPYIKTEPRSPSPYLSTRRPQKRQRTHYTNELNYSRPQLGSDQLLEDRVIDPSVWRPRLYENGPQSKSPEYEPRYRQIRSNDVSQRTTSGPSARWPHSPQTSAPYISSGVRPRAVSTLVAGKIKDDGRYIREPILRGSARPDTDHGRSRSPIHETISSGSLRQIVVDEHGRQYYNATPAPPPPIAQPIGSTVRYRDDDIMYECLPPRTVLGRVPIEGYENESILIRKRSPVYAASRRVVTQPEYISSPSHYHSYRPRGYSAYPTTINPLGEEHDPFRTGPGYRQTPHFEEPSREYLRATTARPEPLNYEIPPKDYINRMAPARPEISPHGPEVRRDIIPRAQREYSIRPIETPSKREPYPVERYYDMPSRVFSHSEHLINHGNNTYYNEPSGQRPVEDFEPIRTGESNRYEDKYRGRPADNSIIDQARARAPSVVVFADKTRRDMYR